MSVSRAKRPQKAKKVPEVSGSVLTHRSGCPFGGCGALPESAQSSSRKFPPHHGTGQMFGRRKHLVDLAEAFCVLKRLRMVLAPNSKEKQNLGGLDTHCTKLGQEHSFFSEPIRRKKTASYLGKKHLHKKTTQKQKQNTIFFLFFLENPNKLALRQEILDVCQEESRTQLRTLQPCSFA